MRVILALLVTVASLTASAATFDFQPVAPTSATPVSLRIDPRAPRCPSKAPEVLRHGREIQVVLSGSGGVCITTLPLSSPELVPLGVLEPGEYVVTGIVQYGDALQIVGSRRLVVQDANPVVVVEPFAVPSTFGGELRIRSLGTAFCSSAPPCPAATVEIGSARIRSVNAGNVLVLGLPAMPAGVYDVTINIEGRAPIVQRAAVAVFDPAQPPDPSVLEPVLFPLLTQVGGAFGSQWLTEGAIRNGNDVAVNPYHVAVYPQLLCSPAPCDRLLAPGSVRQLAGGLYPRGALLYVPRPQAAKMEFSLRVRDLARSAADLGTELRVVREHVLKSGTFRLLDVPVTTPFRTRVRLYAIDAEQATANIAVYDATDGTASLEALWRLSLPLANAACTYDSCTPAYAEYELPAIPASSNVRRVMIEITIGARSWAFATVTNNVTQAVTTVTPN